MNECEKLIELYFKYNGIRRVIEHVKGEYTKYQVFECLKIEKMLVMHLTFLSKKASSHLYSFDEIEKRIEILAKNSKHISINKKILPKILERIKELSLEDYIVLIGYLTASRKKSRNLKPNEKLKDLLLKVSSKVYEHLNRVRIDISKPELKNALKIIFLLMYHEPKYIDYFVKGLLERKRFTKYDELLKELSDYELPYKHEVLFLIKERLKNYLDN